MKIRNHSKIVAIRRWRHRLTEGGALFGKKRDRKQVDREMAQLGEPSLSEIFADPIISLVMKRDHVSREDVLSAYDRDRKC